MISSVSSSHLAWIASKVGGWRHRGGEVNHPTNRKFVENGEFRGGRDKTRKFWRGECSWCNGLSGAIARLAAIGKARERRRRTSAPRRAGRKRACLDRSLVRLRRSGAAGETETTAWRRSLIGPRRLMACPWCARRLLSSESAWALGISAPAGRRRGCGGRS
jgi:hypothetical protein